MKRSRGRGRRQQNPVNRSYDSNGPDVRVRGTASQVYEKYQALARDAMSSGDRVMAENYGQHAEHYYRIMLSLQPAPSEADKEGGENSNADTNGSDNNGSENTGKANGHNGEAEPLVLVRETNDQDDKPAKPSRRRGPLRKKKAESAPEADAASDAPAAEEIAAAEAEAETITADAPAAD